MKDNLRQRSNSYIGDVIKDCLKSFGISQKELARQMETSISRLRSVMKGEMRIDDVFALKLERGTGVSRSFWSGLQEKEDRQKRKTN